VNEKTHVWPDRLKLRDTCLYDDLGGLGQRIYTTAGAGYEKVEYVRADLVAPMLAAQGEEKPIGYWPACHGCGKPLLMENLFVDDGCPCNTPRGVNLTPKPCAICQTDDCVKPGHRITELFGFDAQTTAKAEGCSAEECADCNKLRFTMADILRRTANALKGEPAPLSDHSWHGLPEVAAKLAAQPVAQTGVPEGYVLVPIKPTDGMLEAALRLQGDDAFLAKAPAVVSAFVKIYKAMLAATPTPSKQSKEG